MNYNLIDDCSNVCIEEESGVYYLKSGSESRSGGPNSKKVGYIAYNTKDKFIVEVFFQIISGNANTKATITINVNFDNDNQIDATEVIDEVPSGTTPIVRAFSLPSNWVACQTINFTIYQEGLTSPVSFDEDYNLIGVCSSTCDESFNYEQNEDGSYTFTYLSPEDLEDAEVKFTCPHIASFKAKDDKTYDINPGNSHGSPTVLTWTGDISACTEVTFTLAFDADCTQTNSGKANLFTDFKVNGVSKKGNNENIVFNCSE